MFDILDAIIELLFSSVWQFLLIYFSGVVLVSIGIILYAKFKKKRADFESNFPLIVGSWLSLLVFTIVGIILAFISVLIFIWLGLCKLFGVES